uniref:COesterase domain-containing protein n=1 Tax=Rhabditophanes sp. KR3021 TaxID=114890 RepID=A0AC35U167_9BILA
MSRVITPSILILLHCLGVISGHIVDTLYGKVQGFDYSTAKGSTFNVFLGIPFAKAPVDSLRFEKPVPPFSWEGIKETKKFGPQCVPLQRDGIVFETSEDCLFLNVIKPSTFKEGGYPVLVWVSYGVGTASFYNYKTLAENFVDQGIVVVTINYRLAVFGFGSSGDEDFKGNYGYFDQALAFKFVNENIAAFNGNASDVTAFGLSAGSASVGALSVSPYSRNYISKIIAMSGSALSNWAIGENVVGSTKELGSALNCTTNLKECLRTKSIKQILDSSQLIGTALDDMSLLKFKPRFDGDFFPKPVSELIKESKKIPVYTGFTDQEGSFFTILGLTKSINNIYVEPSHFNQFNESTFLDMIKKLVVTSDRYGKNCDKVTDKILKFYTKHGNNAPKDHIFYLNAYTQLASDLTISVGSLWEAELRSNNDWPVFLYKNTYFNPIYFSDPKIGVGLNVGATHGNEYPYMFNFNIFGTFTWSNEDHLFSKYLTTSIGNFVKTGNPSTDETKWENMGKETKFMELQSYPKMSSHLLQEQSQFWKQLRDEFGYDVVTDTVHKISKKNSEEL